MNHFLAEGQIIKLDVLQTIIQIFVIIIVPVSFGMLIRRFKKDFAIRMEKPVRKASGIVISLVIIGIVIKEKDNIIPYFQQAGIASLVLNVVSMMVGYYSSKLLGIAEKRAISIAIETGIQNGTLAISIAVVLLHNTTFAIAPAVYGILMFFTGGVAVYMGVKKDKAAVRA